MFVEREKGKRMAMKIVAIIEAGNIINQPPTISLIENLLANGNAVKLVSHGGEQLPSKIAWNKRFSYVPLVKVEDDSNLVIKFFSRLKAEHEVKEKTKMVMEQSDILWTTSVNTVRALQQDILKYKNVFQLMELTQYGYTSRHTKFPLGELARKSWKNVVPEENRAYIEKAWWDLSKVPYILPNKPYSLDYGKITEKMVQPLERMKNEKRKILLYLGGIFPDRSLEAYAEAVCRNKEEYVLYIIGKAFDAKAQSRLDSIVKDYNAVYLGYFKAPKHLAFIQYAYIGLLPYKTTHCFGLSDLNALYCAPNKIFEYAAFGIPMIGSNVLGLKNIFEKWDIGYCCNDDSSDELLDCIAKIDSNYEFMGRRCREYYESVDLDKIVQSIISG